MVLKSQGWWSPSDLSGFGGVGQIRAVGMGLSPESKESSDGLFHLLKG